MSVFVFLKKPLKVHRLNLARKETMVEVNRNRKEIRRLHNKIRSLDENLKEKELLLHSAIGKRQHFS